MLRRMLRSGQRGWESSQTIKLNTAKGKTVPFFMHPVIFLSGWVGLAFLFGLQEFAEVSLGGWKVPLWIVLLGWTVRFLLWGLIFLGMWRYLRASIQRASPRQMLLQYLPLSVFISIVEEVLFVTIFRYQAPGKHYTYLDAASSVICPLSWSRN